MSCWVAPTIAADLWGVSLEQIMDGMKSGSIPSRSESGFTFVDVAPHSPKVTTPKTLREPTPPTYSVLTDEETAALTDESPEEATTLTGDWRDVRSQTERLRRAPIAA